MALDYSLLFNFIELNTQDSTCTSTLTRAYLKSISRVLVALCSNRPIMKREIQPIIPRVEKLLAYTQINNLLVLKKVAQPWIASYMLELWN